MHAVHAHTAPPGNGTKLPEAEANIRCERAKTGALLAMVDDDDDDDEDPRSLSMVVVC